MAIKRNEVLTHVTAQENFRNVRLNARSQTQKTKYFMII